jgi:hypothetical protein
MRAELKKKLAGKDFFYFLTRTVLSTIYTGQNHTTHNQIKNWLLGQGVRNTPESTGFKSQPDPSIRSETLRPENRVSRGTPRVTKLYGQGSRVLR